MADPIITAEITGYSSASSTTVTSYFATQEFVSKAADTPAHLAFWARLKQPGRILRTIFDDGTTGGRSTTDFGLVTITNPDGALDSLLDYAYDSRQIKLRYGSTSLEYPSGWTEIFTGVAEQASYDLDVLEWRIRDRQLCLELPVQTVRFAGTNVGPAGYEGTADDIGGTEKPRGWGHVINVAPAPINEPRHVYGVNYDAAGAYAPVSQFAKIRDRTVDLSVGQDHATIASLSATSINSGAAETVLSSGIFRLGAAPQGQVTCDVVFGTTSAERTVAQVYRSILLDYGYATSEIASADIAALDTANAAEIGVYVAGPETVTNLLDIVARSAGAWWSHDRNGTARIVRLEQPASTPVATFKRFTVSTAAVKTDGDILQFDRVPLNDPGRGLPIWEAVVRYAFNNTIQTRDSTADANSSTGYKEYVSREYRNAVASASTVRVTHPLAVTFTTDTRLVNKTAAQTEADRLLTLFRVRRDRYKIRAWVDPVTSETIDLGDTVRLELPRFGLDSGKNFVVIGIESNYRRRKVTLDLWG